MYKCITCNTLNLCRNAPVSKVWLPRPSSPASPVSGSIGYMPDWWVSGDGKVMKYWGGLNYSSNMHACGLNRSCADPRFGCNFDINDYVSRESRELFTTKAGLPVIQLRFGGPLRSCESRHSYSTKYSQCVDVSASLASCWTLVTIYSLKNSLYCASNIRLAHSSQTAFCLQ